MSLKLCHAIELIEAEEKQYFYDQIKKEHGVVIKNNGDVLIKNIPMVNQGPRLLCSTTWERYLRYFDMPADMYLLALVGGVGIFELMLIDGMQLWIRSFHLMVKN